MGLSHVDPFALTPWVVVCGATLVGAVTDIRSRRLPNWLTMPTCLAGLLYAALALPGSHGVVNALAGCAFAGLPFIILWLMGGGSAADAKMMMAVGAWIGSRCRDCSIVGRGVRRGACHNARAGAWSADRDHGEPPTAFAVLPTLLMGPGRFEDRRDAFGANPSSPGSDNVELPGNTRRKSFKLPYGVAIFFGTCVAFVYVLAK